MGKGDKKTRKGKITIGSYGVTRRKKTVAKFVAKTEKEPKVKEKKVVEPKPELVIAEVEKPKRTKKVAVETQATEEKPKAKKTTKKTKEEPTDLFTTT